MFSSRSLFLPVVACLWGAWGASAGASPKTPAAPAPHAQVNVGHPPRPLAVTASADPKGEVTLQAESVRTSLPLQAVETLETREVTLAGGVRVAMNGRLFTPDRVRKDREAGKFVDG